MNATMRLIPPLPVDFYEFLSKVYMPNFLDKFDQHGKCHMCVEIFPHRNKSYIEKYIDTNVTLTFLVRHL